jgi:hypothetical protein
MNTIVRFKAGAAPFNAEEVAGVPHEEAKRLIKGGYAELYTQPVTKVEPPQVEAKVEPDLDDSTEAQSLETKVEPAPAVTKVEPPVKRRGTAAGQA